MSKKKRVSKKNKEKKKPNVKRGKDPNKSDLPLTFNLSRKNWLKCVNLRRVNFTNMLKDEEMFIDYITELFHKIIPIIQKNGEEIIKTGGNGKWKHCHPVTEGKIDLILGIAKKIHGFDIKPAGVSGPQLWQFGVTQGIRLIAIYDYTNNSISPLFVDYHHLVYPSPYYNQSDYHNSFNYCPVARYQKIES